MDDKRIKKEMQELELKINYHFNDISWLAKAMCSTKLNFVNTNNDEHKNDALATVGDTILKFILADNFFRSDNNIRRGKITDLKKDRECNNILHKLCFEEHIIDYAYNDLHFHKDENVPVHENVVSGKHDSYIEAIIAAVYYDSDFETVRKWVQNWLIPLLNKYKE